MDFNIESIMLILIALVSHNVTTRYNLYKDFNNKKEIKLVNPQKLKSDLKLNNKNLENSNLYGEIITFKSRLEKNINKEHLNNMYNNLKTLRSKEKIILPQNLLLILAGGAYDPKNNKITILKLFKNEVINHELLHMASTPPKHNKKTHISGFLQYNTFVINGFGIGLNEGYTEALASRYFNTNDYASNVYKLCKFYSRKLEEIISEDIMLKLYLEGNLPGLIKELRIYDTKENIIAFISNLDFIFKNISVLSNPFIIDKNNFKEKITIKLSEINNTLIKWYIKKKQNELKNGEISSLDFMKDVKYYYNSILDYKYNYPKILKTLETPTKDIYEYSEVKTIKKRYNR